MTVLQQTPPPIDENEKYFFKSRKACVTQNITPSTFTEWHRMIEALENGEVAVATPVGDGDLIGRIKALEDRVEELTMLNHILMTDKAIRDEASTSRLQ